MIQLYLLGIIRAANLYWHIVPQKFSWLAGDFESLLILFWSVLVLVCYIICNENANVVDGPSFLSWNGSFCSLHDMLSDIFFRISRRPICGDFEYLFKCNQFDWLRGRLLSNGVFFNRWTAVTIQVLILSRTSCRRVVATACSVFLSNMSPVTIAAPSLSTVYSIICWKERTGS